MQKWQGINFHSIPDKYVTTVQFDEFIVSLSLITCMQYADLDLTINVFGFHSGCFS